MVQHQNFFKDSWLNMRKWGEGALLNELHQQDLLQFQIRKIGWNRILHSLMTETRIYINCLISRKRKIKRWLPGILKCKNGLRNWMKTHMGRQVWGKDWAWDGWMAPKWGSGRVAPELYATASNYWCTTVCFAFRFFLFGYLECRKHSTAEVFIKVRRIIKLLRFLQN